MSKKDVLVLCGAILGIILGAYIAIEAVTADDTSRFTSNEFGGYPIIWGICGIGAVVVGILLCIPKLRRNLVLIIAEMAIIIGIFINTWSFFNHRTGIKQLFGASYGITTTDALIVCSFLIIPLILLAGLIVPDKKNTRDA